MVVGLLKMDRNELGASLTSRQNEKNFLKIFQPKFNFEFCLQKWNWVCCCTLWY